MTEENEKFTINEILQKMRTNPVANDGRGKYFPCKSGDRLYYRVWESKQQEAIIIAIHGMGAHSEYYIQVADQVIEHGISVLAIDVKHHGLSTGRKGDMKDFGEVLKQLHEFIQKVRSKHPEPPIFVMGLISPGLLHLVTLL